VKIALIQHAVGPGLERNMERARRGTERVDAHNPAPLPCRISTGLLIRIGRNTAGSPACQGELSPLVHSKSA
jgi:hypothetical protein